MQRLRHTLVHSSKQRHVGDKYLHMLCATRRNLVLSVGPQDYAAACLGSVSTRTHLQEAPRGHAFVPAAAGNQLPYFADIRSLGAADGPVLDSLQAR